MCAELCGPLLPPPTKRQRHHRLHVQRIADTDFDERMLAVFDRLTPAQRAAITDPKGSSE